jgi:hypothetical protein
VLSGAVRNCTESVPYKALQTSWSSVDKLSDATATTNDAPSLPYADPLSVNAFRIPSSSLTHSARAPNAPIGRTPSLPRAAADFGIALNSMVHPSSS